MKTRFCVLMILVFAFIIQMNAQSNSTTVSFTPTGNALNVLPYSNITVTFSDTIDQSTLNNSTIKINGTLSGLYTATFSYNSSSKTATINPITNFKVGELVNITLTRGIRNIRGDSLAKAKSWSFTIKVDGGSGQFTQTSTPGVGTDPRGIAIGDFDRDGDIDLAVLNYSPITVSILLNDGNGTFTLGSTIDTELWPNSIATGDFDGDGDIDLAVSNQDDKVLILLNNGSGIFTKSSSPNVGDTPCSVATGDLDGDGDLDLGVANYWSKTVSILLNNGSGTYTQSSTPTFGGNLNSVTAGDLDGDGDVDLALITSGSFYILSNSGSGTFTKSQSMSVGRSLGSIAEGDFDIDGDIDLAITDASADSVYILSNNGIGTFTKSYTLGVSSNPFSITAGDFDGDGDIDLAATECNRDSVAILINNGSGTFILSFMVSVGDNPYSIIAGDLDGDGDLDLVVTNSCSNTVSILINENSPVPVELSTFSASAQHSNAELRWKTETEVNNYGFEVERRKTSNELTRQEAGGQAVTSNWEKVGFVAGAGSSNSPHEYTYSDQKLSAGRYIYRLKQIDNDGTFKYSGSVEIEIKNIPTIFLLEQNYPNPFNPSTTIRFGLPARSKVKLEVFNILGQSVAKLIAGEKEAGFVEATWQPNVASGLYIYRLEAISTDNPNSRFIDVKKMMLLR